MPFLRLFLNIIVEKNCLQMFWQKTCHVLHDVVNFLTGQLVCRIEEEHLWESKQLGAHSPHVLLNTLVYFNTKFFMLKTAEDHMKLSFTHIMKHWKKAPTMKGNSTGRTVYLRYYCPTVQKSSGMWNDVLYKYACVITIGDVSFNQKKVCKPKVKNVE